MILFCSALAAGPAAAKVQDAIIAVVNDDIITVSDLRDYMSAAYHHLLSEGRTQQEIRAALREHESRGVEKLIEDKLILNKANDMGLEVRETLIDERVEKIKQQYPSEQAFLDALVKDGNNITDLRNKIKDQLKVKWVIENEVEAKIAVSPVEVSDFYKQNFELFRKPERITLQSIFVSFGDKEEHEAREKIAQAKAMLGESTFEETAAKFSEAPSPGTVKKGQMLKPIENAVWTLEEGEISDPVEVDNGIYIFKVTEKYPAEVASLEEVKDNIKARLFQLKRRDRLQSWLGELKEKAYIEIKDPLQGPLL